MCADTKTRESRGEGFEEWVEIEADDSGGVIGRMIGVAVHEVFPTHVSTDAIFGPAENLGGIKDLNLSRKLLLELFEHRVVLGGLVNESLNGHLTQRVGLHQESVQYSDRGLTLQTVFGIR